MECYFLKDCWAKGIIFLKEEINWRNFIIVPTISKCLPSNTEFFIHTWHTFQVSFFKKVHVEKVSAFIKKTDKLFEIWLFSTFMEVESLNVVFDFQDSQKYCLVGTFWRKVRLGGFVIYLVSNAHDFYENCNSKLTEISVDSRIFQQRKVFKI